MGTPTMLRPLAQINPDVHTREFWDGCRRRELRFQRCTGCGRFRHPPLYGCPRCGSSTHEWRPVRGRGRIYSYTIAHHAAVPALQAEIPYNVVLVEFDDAPGVRLISNVVGADPAEIRIDLELDLHWDEVDPPAVVLPRFRIAR